MRGRKPKPTQQKRLAGNPGKRRLNDKEPVLPSTKLEPAKINERVKRFSDRYLPMLRETKVLTDADLAAFELMATHYATAWRAAEIIERQGLLQRTGGAMRKHPLLQVLRDQSTAFRNYATEFGLTPSSRGRVKVDGDGNMDPFEEFVRQKLGEPA